MITYLHTHKKAGSIVTRPATLSSGKHHSVEQATQKPAVY